MVLAAASLAACGDKAEKKPGQAMVNVNGQEITVLQLNEELSRANVPAAQQETARKRVLEALIDRQLLEAEALKEKLDRDPKVMQTIERAKSTIVAQAYLQKRIGTPTRPSKTEVEQYFNQNPQFFANRKLFDMRQLVLPTSALTDELKGVIDSSKSMDVVAAWLDEHKVKYGRGQLARSSQELPPELTSKLSTMPKGQLFIIREGERSLLMTVNDIKDAPVSIEQATPQIEQFLVNKKNKEAAEAEVKRLRATAKIEYLNKADAPAGNKPSDPAAAVTGNAAAPAQDVNERGVAGLK
ncbi:peptidyl-prolyl cis-trans isomerase, EpsD family [Pseudoduganella lutea]|uniref:peptidylprolyl isomerase n=2 Tax=Pseudoduganella lutea TaxID=321985 RepID=A0A4P6L6I3_9BURK|nr:peptidyl-prolyl cis-trans isomerase, EpsD family [Pseudoduganella lutea]